MTPIIDLAVIIPTLNAARTLPATIAALGPVAQVVVADLYEEGFSALRECFCVRCDVADPASVEAMIERAIMKKQKSYLNPWLAWHEAEIVQ